MGWIYSILDKFGNVVNVVNFQYICWNYLNYYFYDYWIQFVFLQIREII